MVARSSPARLRTVGVLAVVLLALVVLATAISGGVSAQETVRITDISFDEESFVERTNGGAYRWQSDLRSVSVTIETGPGQGAGHYEVCVESTGHPNQSTYELACRDTELSGDSSEQLTFALDAWPDDLLGPQNVTAVVRAGTLNGSVEATKTRAVYVLHRDGDIDGDGLSNRREVAAGTNLTRADTDGDGLQDSLELDVHETDPLAADTDRDGLEDGPEVHDHRTDPTTADTDDDGLDDALEVHTYGTDPNRADTDGDGLDDGTETNTFGTDPNHPDTDGDGLDDGAEVRDHETDPTAADTDDDGLDDALEVHTYGTNPRKADTDDDGLDDGAEVYDHRTDPTASDTDDDGLADGPELNAHGTNPNRADTDGDGLDDGAEVRTYDTDPTLVDTDGDGVDDASQVGAAGSPLPGWGWVVIAAVVLALVRGLLFLRRYGYPTALTSLGLGPEPSDEPVDETPAPDTGVSQLPGEGLEFEVPLPNKQVVMALLTEHGGRMRQSTVVEQTGWSKAKVSRVLKQMEEDEQVTKINVGRENIVTLPGREPERSRPPFEGEV